MRIRSWHVALVLLVLCAGCDIGRLIENVGTHSELAAVSPDPLSIFPTEPGNVVVPDTATRGAAFTVTVVTHGNKCLKGIDRTDVSHVAADTVVVRPYDFVFAGQCGDALLKLTHTVSVAFTNPGTAVIRVEGVMAHDNPTPVTITRKVVIR